MEKSFTKVTKFQCFGSFKLYGFSKRLENLPPRRANRGVHNYWSEGTSFLDFLVQKNTTLHALLCLLILSHEMNDHHRRHHQQQQQEQPSPPNDFPLPCSSQAPEENQLKDHPLHASIAVGHGMQPAHNEELYTII